MVCVRSGRTDDKRGMHPGTVRKKSKIGEVFSAPHAMLAGVDEEGTLSGRCHAPREEDEHPCMVEWHMRTSALSMMERLAAALSKRNVLFALVS